jgi:uncharacterized membrane protein YidH (DUF202 family)
MSARNPRSIDYLCGSVVSWTLARGVHLSLFQEASMKLIGVLLIVFGLVALAVGGFSYTKQEKILDIGPIHATNEEHKTIPISPIAGVVAVAAGIALVVVDTRKRVL